MIGKESLLTSDKDHKRGNHCDSQDDPPPVEVLLRYDFPLLPSGEVVLTVTRDGRLALGSEDAHLHSPRSAGTAPLFLHFSRLKSQPALLELVGPLRRRSEDEVESERHEGCHCNELEYDASNHNICGRGSRCPCGSAGGSQTAADGLNRDGDEVGDDEDDKVLGFSVRFCRKYGTKVDCTHPGWT